MKTKNMKMKIVELTTLGMIAGLAMLPNAFAQADRGGNGGGAVVCRDSNGKITSARLVDIYEGESSLIGMKFSESGDEYQITNRRLHTLKELQRSFSEVISPEVNAIMNSIRENTDYVKFTDDKLERVMDIYNVSIAAGCEIEQAAVRLSENQKKAYNGVQYVINRPIWNAFNAVNRAALFFHEPIYRMSNQTDSLLSRAVVREALKDDANFFRITTSIFNLGYYKLLPTVEGISYHGVDKIENDESFMYFYTSTGFKVAFDVNGKLNPARTSHLTHQFLVDGWLSNRKSAISFSRGEISIQGASGKQELKGICTINFDIRYYGTFTLAPFEPITITASSKRHQFFQVAINGKDIGDANIRSYTGTIIDFLLPGLKY